MDEESDWDSEPELPPPPKPQPELPPPPKPQPAVTKKPNGTLQHQQGDIEREEPSHDERRDARRSKESRRTTARAESGAVPASGEGSAPPPISSRSGGHHQPRPKQRQQDSGQSESRQSGSRRRQTEQDGSEEQPPFNFRPEAPGGQLRTSSRQKPRPPGRQQRSEYTVSAAETAAPESAQSVTDDVTLKKPASSPGVVRHGVPAVDHPSSSGSSPLTTDRPLVPLDGPLDPLDGPRTGTEAEPEEAAAALAVVVSNYQFSQPDLRTLRSVGQNPSQLLARYGKLSHRQLMKMWSEVLWVASVPFLLITTLFFALIRCVLEAVVRPLTLGPLQLLGDHLLKPAAVTVHDALLLPAATLLANGLSALALVGRPLGDTLDALVRPLATLLASCRPVQVSYGGPPPPARLGADGLQQV